MEFNEQLKQFIKRLSGIKDSISTEEATKMSLIAPFFQLLGYDIFNPNEFCPEYTADVGIKKGEKVDYAILLDKQPIILIEAKSINRKLEKQDSQLFRYFSTTNARFAILTNGIHYKFYTDLTERNKMDREPFYEFNILNLTDDDIHSISQFSKKTFNEENVFNNASLLRYANIFRLELQRQFNNPNDEFVRFFLKEHYPGTKTQNVVERFRPILKKSINDYIEELTNEKMTSLLNNSGFSVPTTSNTSDISDIEFDLLMSIKTILNDLVNMEDITYKKTDSYLAILYQGNARKWIARIVVTDTKLLLIIPDANKVEQRYKLDSPNNINDCSKQLISALNNYLHPAPTTLPIKSDKDINYIYTKWGKYPEPPSYKPYLKYGLPNNK